MAFKFIQRVGVGMMATLALGIQPLQYSILRGVGQALAAPCVPSPTNRCAVNPSEPGTTYPRSVKYYLLPGIGDGPPTNSQSTYFNGTGLPGFLTDTGQTAVPVSAVQPWADWKNTNLTAQGSGLAGDLSSTAAANTDIVLIGHSMGGLRGRSALQLNNTNYPNLQTKVKALVTLGTPNLGAPIIDKGKPAATLLGGVLGVALSAFVGLGPYLSGAVGMFGARAWAASILDTPSGQDMSPPSPFLARLNTPSSAEKIPSNVFILQVIGQNSDIDSYGASAGIAENTAQVGALRSNLGNVTLIAGVIAMGMAFFTFGATIPWALALFAASYLLLNLPAFWRSNVMGSATGDVIVPESNQYMPPAASAGGTQRFLADVKLTFAVHTGKYGEYQAYNNGEYTNANLLQDGLRGLQDTITVPRSR